MAYKIDQQNNKVDLLVEQSSKVDVAVAKQQRYAYRNM